MESGGKNKKRNDREYSKKILRFFYKEEYAKKLEEQMELQKELKNDSPLDKEKVLFFVTIIIIAIATFYANKYYYKDYFKKEDKVVVQEVAKQGANEGLEISSEEIPLCIIDELNNKELKIAYTKLGDNVSYSVTYNNDVIPTGQLQYTSYFSNEYITTVLVNGYPYVSAKDMGLENDTEAYIATQLAVYEVVSRRRVINVSNGTFSLSKLSASDSKYDDMVKRVVKKAEELTNKAIDETYINNYDAGVRYKDETAFNYDEETKIGYLGPIYTYTDYKEEALRVVDSNYISMTSIDIKNYFPENVEVCIVDSDKNEIDKIPTGQDFYIKFKRRN